jgi:hypothetical protein
VSTAGEAPGPFLVVEAEVVAPAAALPPPGFTRALQVDRYRVLNVLQGQYDREELYAARDAGEAFHIGERLRLTLSPDLPDGGTPVIDDPSAINAVGLYFVVSFSRL